MPTNVPCPFCNAPVPVADDAEGSVHLVCPRCEEAHTAQVAKIHADASHVAPVHALVERASDRRPANRVVAGLVVAVMLGMAAIGLAFALHTVKIRRANDSKGVQPAEPAAEAVTAVPAGWPGLGYLPDDVQVMAGIRVADALESPTGRTLLAAFGLAESKRTPILGVAPSHVDCLIAGANLRTLPPRVTAIIHGSIGDSSNAGHVTEQHGKTLQRVKLWASGPEGAIWRPDRHTLVAALLPDDFDRLPAKPQTAQLPDLMARLDPAALAWLVATVDANSPALAFATPFLPPADHDAWAKLQAVAASIRADGPDLALTVQVRGMNAKAGEDIATALAKSLSADRSICGADPVY